MPKSAKHNINRSHPLDRLVPVVYKLSTLWLLTTLGLPMAHAAGDTKQKPIVNVFTTPWSRLFSGSEASFSTALTYSVPLERSAITLPTSRETSETREMLNHRALLSMQYSPLSNFFANTTVNVPLQEVNKYATRFSYSFGYDDWRPNTFSFIYSNYAEDNHFFPQKGKQITEFETGAFTGAYKFELPEGIEKHLLINKDDNIGCQVGYTYSYRYYDSVSDATKRHKNVLLASCGYTLKGRYFLRFSSFYYPEKAQQQPWNSDYTYSFGYISGYKPGAISIRYDNYSGTRYPWKSNSTANFRSGTVSISWTLPW